MARRKKGLFEDLVEIAQILPWWLGLLLAIAAYAFFDHLASQEAASVTSLEELGQSIGQGLIRMLAMFAQYIVPAALLLGAGLSAAGKVRRRKLHDMASVATGQPGVRSLNWREFEMLLGEVFRRQGYSVTEAPPGADGGVDLELRKDGELSLVQCKHWRGTKVGVAVVRELFGVMAARGASAAYVVTSGTFTREAVDFAQGRNIALVDGKELERMLKPVRAAHASRVPTASSPDTAPSQPNRPIDPSPTCPNCSAAMVKRTARTGPSAGKQFWGCPGYPRCKGIRSL